MPEQEPVRTPKRRIWVWVVIIIVAAAIAAGLVWWRLSIEKPPPLPPTTTEAPAVETPAPPAEPEAKTEGQAAEESKVVDVTRPEAETAVPKEEPVVPVEEPVAPKKPEAEPSPEEEIAAEQEQRKEEFGVKESLDAVVKETEKIKVGDEVVDMETITAQVRSQEGEVKEKPAPAEEPPLSPEAQIQEEDIGQASAPSVTARIEEEKPVPREEEAVAEGEAKEERIALAEPEEEAVPAEPEEEAAPVEPKEEAVPAEPEEEAVPAEPEEEAVPAEPEEEAAPVEQKEEAVPAELEEEAVPAEPEEELALAEPEEEPVLAEPQEEPALAEPEEEEVTFYGVHVVRPGENLWNIHFTVLQEYLGHHGLELAPTADEPEDEGRSSGVARILKYAEKMVYIYNVKTGRLTENLDVIQPNQKIVIFNLTRLDKLLRQLDVEKIKRIRFNGTDLIFEG